MEKLIAQEGKIFDYKEVKDDNHLFAKVIILGSRDSADNYIEVDESVMVEWEQEQERQRKEEELMNLMQELHPEFAVQMLGALEQEEETTYDDK